MLQGGAAYLLEQRAEQRLCWLALAQLPSQHSSEAVIRGRGIL